MLIRYFILLFFLSSTCLYAEDTEYYSFKNSFKNSYLIVDGNKDWLAQPRGNGYYYICKKNTPTQCIYIGANGKLKLGYRSSHYFHWFLDRIDYKNNIFKIRNRKFPNYYIHHEYNNLISGSIQSGWLSAQWKLTRYKLSSTSGNYFDNFNITYRDFSNDLGVVNGTRTENLDLGLNESDHGVVVLYRKKLYGNTYKYEFTLSATGNDIKDVFFLALVDTNDKFKKLPIKVMKTNNSELISLSGKGIEIRKNYNDFQTISKNEVRNGISNALSAITGFAIGESSLGTPLATFGLAKNLTSQLFSGVDNALEYVTGKPVGVTAEKQKILPSSSFADDAVNINLFKLYRLVVPAPSNNPSVFDGVRFSLEIEENNNSKSLPRFYLSWINEAGINEQISLEIGTKRSKEPADTFTENLKARSRFIQAYE